MFETKFNYNITTQEASLEYWDNGLLSSWTLANGIITVAALASPNIGSFDDYWASHKDTLAWISSLRQYGFNLKDEPAGYFESEIRSTVTKVEVQFRLDGITAMDVEWNSATDEITLKQRDAFAISWADYLHFIARWNEFYEALRNQKQLNGG